MTVKTPNPEIFFPFRKVAAILSQNNPCNLFRFLDLRRVTECRQYSAYTINVSVNTAGILHGQILSFEEFTRNLQDN